MRLIINSSIRNKFFFLILSVVLMILGINQLRSMPWDTLPEFGAPMVEVQTEALGLSATEVEQLITVPLEQDLLNGVAFLDVIRSESVPGLSSIKMQFDPGTDLLQARQVVNERLTQAHALPNVSKPPQMLQPLSATNRVMMIGLSSKNLSLIDMSVLSRWTIRPRLMGVPGVANVAIWGQRERQLQVLVDPQQLQEKGVLLDQVISTTGNALWVSSLSFLQASTPGTGGFIETPNQRLGVQHLSPIKTAADLEQVTLEQEEGVVSSLRLGDVAKVVEDHQPLIGDAADAKGASIVLVVEKLPGANTLEVTREVEKALKELSPGLAGIKIDSSLFRASSYVEQSTKNLLSALIAGLILLIFIGTLLLGWRRVLIIATAILLSLVSAALVLHLFGATLNITILAGLTLALIVLIDDAIIGSISVGSKSNALLIQNAVLAARSPLSFAIPIVALSILPIFFLTGEAGAFLPPLAIAYATSILTSTLVALIITPVLSLILLANAPFGPSQLQILRWLRPRYERLLTRFIRAPKQAYIIIYVIFLVGLVALLFIRHNQSLIPTFKDTNLLIHWDAAPGTSLAEMNRITNLAGRQLRLVPGVQDVGTHVGRAVMGDQIVNVNSSELWITIDPATDYNQTLTSIRKVVNSYPGINHTVLSFPSMRAEQILIETNKDITVRIYGQNLEVLNSKALEIKQLLLNTHGIVDPKIETQTKEPTIAIKLDLEKAKASGIKPGDVRRATATLLSGIEVGSLFEDQKVFEVVVKGTPEVQNSLTSIANLLIDTPSGNSIRLSDVADVSIKSSPNVLRHETASRYIDINANVKGRSVDATTLEIKNRLQKIKFPLEHHAEISGDKARHEAARMRLIGFIIAAIAGIFLLLQAAFGNWRLAWVIFSVLPLSLAGGLLANFFDGGVVSLGSLAGLLAVLAIAARGCIVLVRRYQFLRQYKKKPFGSALVKLGASEQLAPTILTLFATILVFLPILVLSDKPGGEIVRPMVIVIYGGLITATLINLLVIPILYLQFGSQKPNFIDFAETDDVLERRTKNA